MKTKMIIEIETPEPNTLKVWEDADKTAEDYTPEQLKKFREEWAKELHSGVVRFIESYFEDDLEENLLDSSYIEEQTIEDWESFDDYGIKVTTKVETPKKDN